MSNPNNTGKKVFLTTQAVVLIIVLVLVLSGTALAAVLILRQPVTEATPEPTTTPIPGGAPVLTEENYVEIQEELQQKVEAGMFETYYTSTWVFPDGKSPASSALMGNSSGNLYPFYFTVTLSGETEPIFTSGVLPLGTQIGEIKLDRELPQGTYSAILGIYMVDDEGNPVESNVGFSITLVIQN